MVADFTDEFSIGEAQTARPARSSSTMKTLISIILAGAISIGIAQAQGDRAVTAAQDTANTARNMERSVARGMEDAGNTVAEARTPDPDARKVNVTMTEYRFDMPTTLKPGKTAFIVKNAGKKTHNFEIKGNGVDQKFAANLRSGQSRVLHVVLKRGTYDVTCPVDFHMMKGMTAKVTVR